MNPYQQVEALRPGRSAFDLSQLRIFDVDVGKLIPIMCEDVVPGDVWKIGNMHIIRAQPLVCPIYHKLSVYAHYFFVPYRLLMKDWEKFITGGVDGDSLVSLPKLFDRYGFADDVNIRRYDLWDYFGLPIHNPVTGNAENSVLLTHATDVIELPFRAYWVIWRDYYRDATLQTRYPTLTNQASNSPECLQDAGEQLDSLDSWFVGDDYVDLVTGQPAFLAPAYRCWQKDYFTSAMPWQQRGTSPAVVIGGVARAEWDPTAIVAAAGGGDFGFQASGLDPRAFVGAGNQEANAISFFNDNEVDWGTSGIDIADLRYAVQVQKWMERNARAGFRYNEFLNAHYGVSPRDERLQRPEYIGGNVSPVIISEVLQTSESATTPQANMAGHGMSVNSEFVTKYHCKEHGLIMGILSIMPEAVYQQGVPRYWLKQTRFDFYSPEFAHLSEQEIKKGELYYQYNKSLDDVRFGFQGAFDEYRQRNNIVCGQMAKDLDDWTLSRLFTGVPSLNEEFITTQQLSENRRDAWEVVAGTAQFLVQWRNMVTAIRPMPFIPDPGLMDHF